jgi:hypothetical protein
MMRSSGSDFSVFGDDHRLRFDLDFVHDGEAISLKTPAGIVFSHFLMVPWNQPLRRMRYN